MSLPLYSFLSGSLWVVRTRASWRDLLLELGECKTAYKRCRLWQANGLWQRLLIVLHDDAQSQARQLTV